MTTMHAIRLQRMVPPLRPGAGRSFFAGAAAPIVAPFGSLPQPYGERVNSRGHPRLGVGDGGQRVWRRCGDRGRRAVRPDAGDRARAARRARAAAEREAVDHDLSPGERDPGADDGALPPPRLRQPGARARPAARLSDGRHLLDALRALPASGRAKELVKRLGGSWSAAELPHRCSQMYIERVLRDEAEKLPSVQLWFNWRVTGFAELGDRAEVTAEPAEGGAPRRFTGRYLVAADGARSLVRKELGISLSGESGAVREYMGGPQHAIHFRSRQLLDRINGARAWQY